eukprot:g2091.t1
MASTKVDATAAVITDRICILDAGAQYAKVIDRRVRELAVESIILPLSTPAKTIAEGGFQGIIISGGPESVYGKDAPKYDPDTFALGIPIFGICYGLQLINHVHGGKVEKKDMREDGVFDISVVAKSDILHGLGDKLPVLLTHGDSITKIADGFTVTARSNGGVVTTIEDSKRRIYGVQFHPEVDLTRDGVSMFRNFLFRVCGLTGNFTMVSRKTQAIQEIREAVGDLSVISLVSGGVDSTVCTALLQAAIPTDRIYSIHVDSGFMRHNESANVKAALKKIGMDLNVVNGQDTFANATTEIDGETTERLCDTVRPEVKRKIIGDTFMRISEQCLKDMKLDATKVLLAQGTLRPDLIESASNLASTGGSAHVIKTHHNDTALVRKLRDQGRIIEPLKDYHKDEVRALGMDLGLPKHLVWRQPFPGPGLAIRILCAKAAYLPDDVDSVVKSIERESSAIDPKIRASLLPCRSVGVQGDCRSYRSLVGLSTDAAEPNWSKLLEIAKEIPKRCHEVNRVVYIFGPRLKSSVLRSVTPTTLTTDVVSQLRAADDIVNQTLVKYDLIRKLSQVPVVLFPVDFGVKGSRAIAIRTFITNDFMTGLPATPGKDLPTKALTEIIMRITSEVAGISRVCYDLTSKPPATTEWE